MASTDDSGASQTSKEFTPAELGAIAHLYRGEVFRSTTWRTRLDNTTNWAVVTTGLALSLSFSQTQASALPILVVGLLIIVFLLLEARRYRYFNVWRARCRLLETDVFSPLLMGEGVKADGKWNTLLAQDYRRPYFHISYARAIGRRLRKSYAYILSIHAIAYFGKLIIHPGPLDSMAQLYERASVGSIPGQYVLLAGLLFHGTWITFALVTLAIDKKSRRPGQLISIA
ncbi:MAG: DUF2270 domain-containing protein [Pseudomonadota bacterium]